MKLVSVHCDYKEGCENFTVMKRDDEVFALSDYGWMALRVSTLSWKPGQDYSVEVEYYCPEHSRVISKVLACPWVGDDEDSADEEPPSASYNFCHWVLSGRPVGSEPEGA